jgi:hypothetical protein
MVLLSRIVICVFPVLGLVGCEDPNKMFEGKWESTSQYDAFEGQLRGVPHLAIGHFGLEVTGVAFFYKALGGSAPETECPCVFIDQQEAHRVDLANQELSFSTKCDAIELSETASITLDWHLRLISEDTLEEVEERYLTGTVRRADGGEAEMIKLIRTDVILEQADKECSP